MHWYVESTGDASRALIRLIASERATRKRLEGEYESAAQKQEYTYEDFRSSDLQEDFNDLQVMAKFQRASVAGEDANEAKRQLENLKFRLEARASSYGAVCGALLQIAKQGLSAQFGKSRKNVPEGKLISVEPIRNIIWEGRNQSMHFEVPEQVGPVIRETFRNLEMAGNPQFHLDPAPAIQRNLAGEVIELLGWWEPDTYACDLETLLTSSP